jgi:S-formylglutathione hydrolase FrmB
VLRANDPSLYVRLIGAQLLRYPLHAYLYKGRKEPADVKARAREFADELRAMGGHVTYKVFGGGHSWRIWRDQTPRMLAYASHWFGARR